MQAPSQSSGGAAPMQSAPTRTGSLHAVPRFFVLAAVVEACLSASFVVKAIVGRDDLALPGALIRIAVMAGLAWWAIRRGSRLARLLFAVLELATAAIIAAYTLAGAPDGSLLFSRVGILMAMGYLVLGLAASSRR